MPEIFEGFSERFWFLALDRDRVERLQEGRAAQGQAAGPDPSPHLGLVPRSHLPHLDADRVFHGQVGDQPAVVDPSLGSVINGDLSAIEGLLGADELHGQVLVAGQTPGIRQELPLAGHLGVVGRQVRVRGDPDDPLGVA